MLFRKTLFSSRAFMHPSARATRARKGARHAMTALATALCVVAYATGDSLNDEGASSDGLPACQGYLSLLCERLASESPPLEAASWLGVVAVIVLTMIIQNGVIDADGAYRLRWARRVVEQLVEGRGELYRRPGLRPALHSDSDSVADPDRVVCATESSSSPHATVDLTVRGLLSSALPLDSSDPFRGTTEIPPDVVAMLCMWELEKNRFVRFGGIYSALSVEDEWNMLRERNTWDSEPADLFDSPSVILIAEMRHRPFMLSQIVYLARYGLWHRRVHVVQTTIWARRCLMMMNPTIPRMYRWMATLVRARTFPDFFHEHSHTRDEERSTAGGLWVAARLTTHPLDVDTRHIPGAQRLHLWALLNARNVLAAQRAAARQPFPSLRRDANSMVERRPTWLSDWWEVHGVSMSQHSAAGSSVEAEVVARRTGVHRDLLSYDPERADDAYDDALPTYAHTRTPNMDVLGNLRAAHARLMGPAIGLPVAIPPVHPRAVPRGLAGDPVGFDEQAAVDLHTDSESGSDEAEPETEPNFGERRLPFARPVWPTIDILQHAAVHIENLYHPTNQWRPVLSTRSWLTAMPDTIRRSWLTYPDDVVIHRLINPTSHLLAEMGQGRIKDALAMLILSVTGAQCAICHRILAWVEFNSLEWCDNCHLLFCKSPPCRREHSSSCELPLIQGRSLFIVWSAVPGVPSRLADWDVTLNIPPTMTAEETLGEPEDENVDDGAVLPRLREQPQREPNNRSLLPLRDPGSVFLGNWHFTPCCVMCGEALVLGNRVCIYFVPCNVCHTLTCATCWRNGRGCVHVEPRPVVLDEADVDGESAQQYPTTPQTFRRHPLADAGRMGLSLEIYVCRAPFPSRCPACTCFPIPCLASPGHAADFVCAHCNWVICEHCERGGECETCAYNVGMFQGAFRSGRRIRGEGCQSQLPFGSFPTACSMCDRHLCLQCLAAHRDSCGQIVTSRCRQPCVECGVLLQAGTQAQRCPQCGHYVCLSCTKAHRTCAMLGGAPARASCDQCGLTPAAMFLYVCRSCDVALCALCLSHGYLCLCQTGPSPFPARPIQEQRFFTHPHLARCGVCGASAGSGHWTMHYCSEHRVVVCIRCIQIGMTGYAGPCRCFAPVPVEGPVVSKRGLHHCMYCDFEDAGLCACPYCGQVVCQMHPLFQGPHRCRCWTSDVRYRC